MATRGFTDRSKEVILKKIRQMDKKIDTARRYYESGQIDKIVQLLRELENMKVDELITCFPDIALADRRSDIPFSVIYETLYGIMRTLYDFLEWLARERRKPKDKRHLEDREQFIIRLRRLLNDLNYWNKLKWPDGDPAKEWLKKLIEKLEAIIERIENLDHDNLDQAMFDEIDSVDFARAVNELLGKLSDEGFSLQSLYYYLSVFNNRAIQTRQGVPSTDENKTADQLKWIFEADMKALGRHKHEIRNLVTAAPTVGKTGGGFKKENY